MSERPLTALILAAGVGRRLGPAGETLPKGFLQLGTRPIIAESLARLRRAGIERAVLVTGHHADRYAALRVDDGPRLETVHNPHFADSGSLYSWLQAAPRLAGAGYLLLESDLVYEQRALTTLVDDPADSAVLLSGPTGAGDEVWVEVDGPPAAMTLVAMAKDRARLGANIGGELVGICKISARLHDALAAAAERLLATTRHADYESDGLVAAAAELPIPCRRVDDLLWAEIDDAAHLARARALYPRLA
ncbi:MAG TPA: phosphocholine cytidylyltransferase family protein [Gammaproteobacteria bacterium]